MALDTSMLLQVQPTATPQENQARALGIRSAQEGLKTSQLQNQQLENQSRFDQYMKANPNATDAELMANGGAASLPILRAKREATRAQTEAQIAQITQHQKMAERAASILGSVTDQQTLESGLKQAVAEGLEKPEIATQVMMHGYQNPQVQSYLKQHTAQALSAIQMAEEGRANANQKIKQDDHDFEVSLQGFKKTKFEADAKTAVADATIKSKEAEMLTSSDSPKMYMDAIDQVVKGKANAALNQRTKDLVGLALRQGDIKGAKQAIHDAAAEVGKVELATNPAVQQAKINVSVGAQTAKDSARTPGSDALDLMAEQVLNGQQPSSRNQTLVAKVYDRAAEIAKERGMSNQSVILQRNAAKAANTALTAVTKQYETLKPFADMAEKNANILEQKSKDVADLGGSFLNTPIRELSSKFGGTKVAAFRAALLPVQADFARILNSPNGSGVLTDSARKEMEKAIGDGATVGQIKAALDVFRKDAANRRESYDATIKDLQGRTAIGGGGGNVKTWNPKTNKFE